MGYATHCICGVCITHLLFGKQFLANLMLTETAKEFLKAFFYQPKIKFLS